MKNKTANTLRKIFSDKHNRELVVDSSIAFAIRGGAAAAAFIMNVIISRKLGAHEAGNFFLAFSVITILGTVVRMGGDYVVLRYVGIYGTEKKWVEVRGVIKNIITRVLLFSLLLAALTLIFTGFISESIFHKKDVSGSFYWMFLAMPLLGIYTLYAFALQGLKKVLLSVAIQNLVVPILVMLFVYILHPKTSTELSKLYFFSSLITMGMTFYFWKRFVPAGKGEFDSSLLWKSCYALWTMAILQQAVQWGGQIITGMYRNITSDSLAGLAAAQRTSMLITFIGIAINLVSAPRFASLYSQRKMDELKRYSVNTTRLMFLFATPLIILVWLFPQYILSLFGKDFESAVWMLRILALGQYINIVTGSVGYLLMMSGHEKDMRNITIACGVISIILNFALIQLLGILGAALAIAISVAIQNLWAYRMVKKRLGFSTIGSIH